MKKPFKLLQLRWLFKPKDRDCRISLWSPWSACSMACHGLRQRVRRVVALAAGSGKPCSLVNEPTGTYREPGRASDFSLSKDVFKMNCFGFVECFSKVFCKTVLVFCLTLGLSSHAAGDEESLTEVSDCNPIAGEATPAACGPNVEVKETSLESPSSGGFERVFPRKDEEW